MARGEEIGYNDIKTMAEFEIRQTLKTIQKLALTLQMRQSLHILQLPTMELRNLITQELESNPMLEEIEVATEAEEDTSRSEEKIEESLPPEIRELVEEDGDWRSYLSQAIADDEKRAYQESLITTPVSPQEELFRQLKVVIHDRPRLEIGEYLLGNLDESGYLVGTTEEVAQVFGVEEKQVEEVLKIIQRLDPSGVGARDLRECLLAQLEELNLKQTLAYRIVQEGLLDDLSKRRYLPLHRKLKVDQKAIEEARNQISRLEPHPGRLLFHERPSYIRPDLIVTKRQNQFEVTFANEGIPSIRINPLYKKLLKESPDKKTKEFIQEKFKSAAWLIRALHQRRQTISKVVEVVLEFQKEFLEKGVDALKPLTMKEVASLLQCHESTISRAVMNKTIETPHGLFELKAFFGREAKSLDRETHATSQGVKSALQRLIQEEDPRHPLSDEGLVKRLQTEGFHVARRTVAKYRQELKILPTHLRRR